MVTLKTLYGLLISNFEFWVSSVNFWISYLVNSKRVLNWLFYLLITATFLISFAWTSTAAWTQADIPDTIFKEIKDKVVKVDQATDLKDSFLSKEVIPNLIKMLFYLASAIAVASASYAGFTMMTSLWESERLAKWWKIVSYTVVGLVVMLLSRWIVWIVENLRISSSKTDLSELWLGSSTDLWNLPSWAIESEVLPKIIWILVETTALIIIIMIIYAWVLYVTALWVEDRRTKAKDIIIDLMIWLWVLLTSYVLVSGVLKLDF